ncbi:hypothetical protein [Halobacillus trueperi]|uniref:Uncharacterized protein n=1 Tax=Halobacillus trueperi TaxID=156205 RepID=A0A3E0IYA1_9BACI|nr:hypothetical protein [Halobacillus trueperi]REJ05637.1 hypothetical protein DYE48_20345 [Halobacillus trueperi]
MSPTVPFWIVAIFYLFIIISFSMAIRMIIKKQLLISSLISIVLIPLSTILLVFSSIGRGNQNEFEYFINSVREFELWAWLWLVIFAYLLYWWYLVFRYKKQEK